MRLRLEVLALALVVGASLAARKPPSHGRFLNFQLKDLVEDRFQQSLDWMIEAAQK